MTEANCENIKIDGLSCSFSVVIPDADIRERCEKNVKQYLRDYTPHGFRKGKIPESYVKTKSYEVRESMLAEIIPTKVEEFAEKNNLSLYMKPDLKLVKNEYGEDVHVSVTGILTPSINLESLSKEHFTKFNCVISDQEVQYNFDRFVEDISAWSSADSAFTEQHGVELQITLVDNEDEDDDADSRISYASLAHANYLADNFSGVLRRLGLGQELLPQLLTAVDSLRGKSKDYEVSVNDVLQLKIVDVLKISLMDNDKLVGVLAVENLEAIHNYMRRNIEYDVHKKTSEIHFSRFYEMSKRLFDFEVPELLLKDEQFAQQDHDEELLEKIRFSMVLVALSKFVTIDEDRIIQLIKAQDHMLLEQPSRKLQLAIRGYAFNKVAEEQSIEFAMDKMQCETRDVEYSELRELAYSLRDQGLRHD